jgi:DNA-binding transcriptional regulator/RsmH inhibitor MraZ
MMDILWIAIISGLLAGIGALNLHLIMWKYKKNSKLTTFLVIIIVVISMNIGKNIPNPLPTREKKALKKIEEQFMSLTGFQEKLESIPKEELKTYSQNLGASGTRKLDNETLLRLWDIKNSMVNGMSETSCATFAKGKPPEEGFKVFEPLSDQELEDYVNIVYQSVAAEINEEIPRIPLDEDAVTKAIEGFLEVITDEEYTRYMAVSENPETTSDEDACWAQKLIFSRVKLLDESDQMTWARIVVNAE